MSLKYEPNQPPTPGVRPSKVKATSQRPYRGTSPIRNRPPLGSYSRTMPRALRWSQGGGGFLISEVLRYPPCFGDATTSGTMAIRCVGEPVASLRVWRRTNRVQNNDHTTPNGDHVVPIRCVGMVIPDEMCQEVRCWGREFKLSWREAGPPNHHDDKADSDQ